MLETHTSDRRGFWMILTVISAVAAVVAWNVL